MGLLVWYYTYEMRLHMNCENCMNGLHQLGWGMQMYARQHNGQWPDSLAELMRAEDLSPIQFVCPASDDTPAEGSDWKTQANNLTTGGHLSYVYFGKGLVEPVADSELLAVACDREVVHGSLGLNVLFADGHCETLPPPQAKRFLATARATTRPIRWPPPQ